MAEFFCDIEILRNEGEFEARVEGLTPNVMSLKSDNLEELLEQLNRNTVSCKDVNFRIFGFSLAAINTIFSIFLSAIFIKILINYGKN